MGNQLTIKRAGLSQAEILALIAANAAPLAHNTQHQNGGIDQLNISSLLGQHAIPLINSAAGILPVATSFDVNPTDLINCTDENMSSVTGIGSKVLASTGVFGNITLILPINSHYLVSAVVGVWSTTGTSTALIFQSLDGITFISPGVNVLNKTTTTELKTTTMPACITSDRFRIQLYGSTAGTYYVKIYEIMAHKLM